MASLNSITGTLSSTSSLRGYGGLSSGLDRDSLIESLTYGTRTKIEAQNAKKTKLGWTQTTLRGIIDKAYNFTNTYTSYTSSSNLTSSTLFSRTKLSVSGEYSKYVSVSGSISSGDPFSILGVRQLASDAKYTGSVASSSQLTTGDIDFTKEVAIDSLRGTYLSVKVGNTLYNADISNIDAAAFENNPREAIAVALNKAFADEKLSNGKSLDTAIKATVEDGKLVLSGIGGNAVKLSGGSAAKVLGLEDQDITGKSVAISDDIVNKVVTKQAAGAFLAGKTLTFAYNGTSKTITLGKDVGTLDKLQADLQTKMNEAFGKDRIKVEKSGDGLSFKTMNVQDGGVDNTSTLTLAGGSYNVVGKTGVFGIAVGTTNRVDTAKSLEKAGLNGMTFDANGKASITINDRTFEFDKSASVQEVLNTINQSGVGVKISYSSSSDKFSIVSNEKGASGKIEMSGTIAEAFFGKEDFDAAEAAGTGRKVSVAGKDAVVAIKYAGDDEETMIYRNSNSFTVDGLNVTVKGAFGFEDAKDADGNVIKDASGNVKQTLKADSEAVTIEASVDADKAVETVKNMIDAYNEIVALVNSELRAKPDKNYKSLLTSEQKKELSDTEIEEYETKAKQGLLFGDNDLRRFADDLRFTISGGNAFALSQIGISESTEYSDNGKLVFDEQKFREALEKDPENIDKLFNGKTENGQTAGLMTNIKDVMNKYCGTKGATKGVLVERAGSEHSPLSLLQNTMKDQIDEIDDYIEKLLDRLESEEDRYIKQFTSLETLISQMNSQSSYLSSLNS